MQLIHIQGIPICCKWSPDIQPTA